MLEFQFRRCVEGLRLMESNLRVWNALIHMSFGCWSGGYVRGLGVAKWKVKYFEKKMCDACGALLGRGSQP